jgi:hypothetical protein
MEKIYKKALRIARDRMFDDPKYETIAQFCKYKLDNTIYTRNESTKYWATGREIETEVFITTEKADNFADYKQKYNESKNTARHDVYIGE